MSHRWCSCTLAPTTTTALPVMQGKHPSLSHRHSFAKKTPASVPAPMGLAHLCRLAAMLAAFRCSCMRSRCSSSSAVLAFSSMIFSSSSSRWYACRYQRGWDQTDMECLLALWAITSSLAAAELCRLCASSSVHWMQRQTPDTVAGSFSD